MKKYFIQVSYLHKNWQWLMSYEDDVKIKTKSQYFDLLERIKKWITRANDIGNIIIVNILYFDNK